MKTHALIGMILIMGGCSPRFQNENASPPRTVTSAGHVIVPATDNNSEWTIEESGVTTVEVLINALLEKPDERMQSVAGAKPNKALFLLSDYYL